MAPLSAARPDCTPSRGIAPVTEDRQLRDHLATAAMRTVNAASRRTGRGSGTVAGARVAMRLAPGLLERLASRTEVALVSGTNGKTTTTALLTAALSTRGVVATNATGSNMPEGHLAALAAAPGARAAVLECDEVWLATVLALERPAAIVLLNLSRDQLDRTAEVRNVARAWRSALVGYDGVCIANADDPLVVYAARVASRPAWFAGGRTWSEDAASCPNCLRHLDLSGAGWACECGESRPLPDAIETSSGAIVDGQEVPYDVGLPGLFNGANALAALLAAVRLGTPASDAARAISSVSEVAGRFAQVDIGGRQVRLMLAKNPAGWTALLDLVEHDATPLVLALNANAADGRDPSWIYDVAFERLNGRSVVASGERWRDMSTRLFYAAVPHSADGDVVAAIRAVGPGHVDVIANYTAFATLWSMAKAVS
jgi:UDP-N-acetylmuramyl tripeptide synthase